MTFEDYLLSKKIDASAFKAAESQLYEKWNLEFAQMHPNSFTSQKLYLINPIRLKYRLNQESIKPVAENVSANEEKLSNKISTPSSEVKSEVTETKKSQVVIKPARPVFKSKPKID